MNIIFMGRKSYSADILEWTVSQGIRVLGVVTDSHIVNSPTKKRAEKLGIEIISVEKANELVSTGNVDLVVSYLFWKRIKEPLISKPKYGCINFHPAILPDWRGLGGYNIAILEKLNEWGATAHYIDENIDTGDIIKIYKFNFDYRNETAQSLEEKTQRIQMDLYKSVILDFLENGKLNSIKQDYRIGRYISKKEMLDMMKINPDVDDIDLKIRAFWFPPYSGAYLEYNGKQYTLVNDYILKQLGKKGEMYSV